MLVPTSGRKSLLATLASILEQVEPGDEVIVRASRHDDFGHATRQSMMESANGTHLLFMDDDDQFARGALATMRQFAREHPGRIGIFRMRYLDGRVLWTEPVLRLRNVGTPMMCIPNIPGRLGRWESPAYPRVADYEFLRATVDLQREPIFRDEIVAHIRSDRRPLPRALKRMTAPIVELRYRVSPRTRFVRALSRLPRPARRSTG